MCQKCKSVKILDDLDVVDGVSNMDDIPVNEEDLVCDGLCGDVQCPTYSSSVSQLAVDVAKEGVKKGADSFSSFNFGEHIFSKIISK